MRLNVVVGVLLSVGVVSCRDLSVPPPPAVNTFITGRAVIAVAGSAQSQAVAGADLSVLGSNVHVTTDALGGFTLGPLPVGEYQVLAAAHGDHDTLHQRLVSGIQTTGGATRSLGDVLLAENAQLGGRVLVDGQQQGNAGVIVFVPGTDFVTNSTDTGGWVLETLPAGVVRASAFRAGFEPATTSDVTVQGGVVTSTADLLLFPESASAPHGSIAGSVVVMGAADNAGVRVAVVSSLTQVEVAHVVTDATGSFSLIDLPSDLYTLTASLSGYGSLRVPNLGIGAGVNLTLAGALVLSPPGADNTPGDGGLGSPTIVDAGVDAGVVDSGTPDAGAPDAGTPDAGVPDAGADDAGLVDGGFVGECLTEAQCAAGLLCVNHACVNCSATAPCGTGSSCHGGVCLVDCATNANCADGQVCRGGSCSACQSSAECLDPALICDATGACTHCQNRGQCPSGKACFASGCGTCSLDSDCGAGSLCEQGVCLTGNCHTNQGCPTTQSCVSHACTTCGQDTDCRAGQLCLSGACVVGNCRGVADCNAGQLCRNNLCGACANDVDCGAGSLCLSTGAGLLCQPGVCRTNVDCVGSNAGEVCNAAHQCVPCATKADCADATKICDPTSSRCVTGNCATATDCTTLGLAGEVCLSNSCAACTLDTQCVAGQLCFSGRCKAGTCKDNTWCSGGTQLCELTTTNPVAAQYTCRPCAPVATLNSADCGGTNRICTATGACRTGTCLTASQCGSQLACINNACTACATDVDCGGNGLLCVNARCVTGTCHGTGTDPNVDCGPTQVCAGNLCVGNCRSNADCAGTVANPGTNWCDTTTTHSCVPCTSTNQCGGAATGKVCASGTCVTGQCTMLGATPNDTACGTGLSCVANQCVQVGPLPVNPTPYTEPLPVTAASMVVSGGSQLYYSSIDSAGSFSLALDGSRAKVWRVSDSASTSRPFGPLNAGLVLPAPGFPQGELFLSPSGLGTVIAHRADTGAPAWTIAGSTAMSAVSMIGGVPQFVRADNSGGSFSFVTLMRTDGTHQRTIGLSGCGGNLNMLVAGTSFVYAMCYNAVYGIDPINDVVSWIYPVSLVNSQTFAMVWRPAGLTGAAAGDLLVTTATGGNATLLGLFVPDFTGGPVVPTAHINYTNFGAVGLNPVIDPAGAVYLFLGGGTPKLTKVSLIDGSTLATVTLPVSPVTMNLAGDGTLVVTSSIAAGLYALSGITITNGSPGTATLKWQVGSSTFSVAPGFPAFSTVPVVGPDGGVVTGGIIDMLTANSTGVSQELSALAAPGPSFLYSTPQWGVAGDPGNRGSAPGFDCTTNANCGANQLCVLNHCIGTCRTAATCAAGLGCILANCGPCPIDSACRAGEVCNAGVCLACNRATNPSCCATNAECGTGACVQGLCRAMPSASASGVWLKPLTGQTSSTFPQVQGTDGTLYVLDNAGAPALHAFGSDGTALWTSPAAPTGIVLGPQLMVVRVGAQDVVFAISTSSNTFFTAVVSAAGFGGWKSVVMTGLNASISAMAQGVSSALTPNKSAVYMSGSGKLWAVDPVAAASGTFNPLWQQPNTGCNEPTTTGGNWVMVGSDATVYHVCNDGSVQAWHPDGQVLQPLGLTRPGALLYTSTPTVLYPSSPAPRPALAAIPGNPDVLYLSQGTTTLDSSVLRVSAAGVASRTEVLANANVGFVVDGAGNAVAFSTNTTQNFSAITPAGVLAGTQNGVYSFAGANLLMTTDGLAWFVDQKTTPYAVVGLQVNSLATPTQAVRFVAQGGLGWDTTAALGFLPNAQSTTGSAMLLGDNNLTGLGYGNRMLSGIPLASGSATLTTWGTVGGDSQHRASLKVQ